MSAPTYLADGHKTVPLCQLMVTRLYPVSADGHNTVLVSADSHKTVPVSADGNKTVPPCQLMVTRLYPVSADGHKTVPRVS